MSYKFDPNLILANLPDELQDNDLNIWLCWKYEIREGKATKVPYQPNGHYAKSNDPNTWTDLTSCLWAVEESPKQFSGVGLVLTEDLVGYDLDHIDEHPEHKELLDRVVSSGSAYVEFSPSGEGLRILLRGELPRAGKGTKHKWVEAYDKTSPRYLTITGDAFNKISHLQYDQELINWIHERFFKKDDPPPKTQPPPQTHLLSLPDHELVERAGHASNGHHFLRLYNGSWDGYPSQSEADSAFCVHLAFWTQGDVSQMDRVFRRSGLMRDKWDRVSNSKGETYGDMTLRRALEQTSTFYDPARPTEGATVPAPAGGVSKTGKGAPQTNTSPPNTQDDPFRNFKKLGRLHRLTEGGDLDPLPIAPDRPTSQSFPRTPLHFVIEAVHRVSQAPYTLCAQSVLAYASFATQHLANIATPGLGGPENSSQPLSCFFITVAQSGERKSTVDRLAGRGVAQYQRDLEKLHAERKREHTEALWQWEQHEKIRLKEGGGPPTDPPQEPRQPILQLREPTQEGLFRSLKLGQLSQGLFNDEGGVFLGGFSMAKEQRMRTVSTLNKTWDGGELDRPRAQEYEVLRGRRLSVHLQIQPKASAELLGDGMLTDLGFSARCLVADPESAIGSRHYQRPSQEDLYIIDSWATQVKCLLELAGREDEYGLAPRPLELAPEAEELWIQFYNETEDLMPRHPELTGWLAKAGQHALRLAGMFTLVGEPKSHQIPLSHMQTAVQLTQFYLSEQLRANIERPTEADENTQRLLTWMHERWEDSIISLADICRLGPSKTRKADSARRAVETLVGLGHLQPLPGTHQIKNKPRQQCFKITTAEQVEQALSQACEVSQVLSQPLSQNNPSQKQKDSQLSQLSQSFGRSPPDVGEPDTSAKHAKAAKVHVTRRE